uniref:Kazal-like domain-containing protein n=1 Tax=viral metagenome TaxID=1070528 RepID=A0A6C0ISE6_9ZZZZ
MNTNSVSPYTLLPHQDSKVMNCCEKCDVWCFHHSSLGTIREYGANTWFRYLDCCSTCLELQCDNICSHCLVEICQNTSNEYVDDCVVLCCCVSYTLI